MQCYYRYIVGIILVAVFIVQVSCNDEAAETHNREKRQDFGHRRQPHHRGEGPGRNHDDRRRPEGPENTRYAQPLSLSPNGSPDGVGFNGLNNAPQVEGRFGETQNQGLGGLNNVLGLGMGLGGGGGGGAQRASAMSLQAAQNAAALGNSAGGFGGMPNLGGFGGQDASRYRLQAAENAANAANNANLAAGQAFPNTAAPSTSLLSLGGQPGSGGGLLGLGGQSNGALINIGGPGLISIGGQPNQPQTDNRPQGPGHNPPGHQGNNRPGGPPPGRPGGRPGPPSSGGQVGRPGQQNGRPDAGGLNGQNWSNGQNSGQNGQQGNQGQNGFNGQNGQQGQNGFDGEDGQQGQNGFNGQNGQQGQNGFNGQNSGQNGQNGSNGRPVGTTNDQYEGNGNSGQQSNSQNQGAGSGGGKKKCRGNQYTCQNRECVQRNARCNGVNDCQDGSDESNCYTSENGSGGQGSSVDRATTAAPQSGVTTLTSAEGCILPEQPTGGSFELGSCQRPCNVAAGTRVPATSFLTYKCNTGYTLNGNNVTFCHGGSWYAPPTCAKTCSPLKSNSVDIVCKLDGKVVSCESSIAPGTTATLACKHSFKIPITEDPAYRELTCLEEGIWDRTLFRCLPECGTAVSHGNTLIVNGFTAKLGVFPWHVGIYERNSAGNFEQICAGTLVGPDLVVSAAHCFYDDTINEVMDARKYAVAAGKHYRLYNMPEKYAQTSAVKKIDVASRYFGASGNFAQDISLVRLERPFNLTTLVRPVCMDWENAHEREQLISGQSGKAVGWGKTSEGVPSTELQEINLPFIPYQECVSTVPEEFRGYVTADKFCAGYLNGSSLCEGDSGGGLCFQLNGLWYLRGIVSVSPVHENTCDNNYYTAFTNVGRFREWIRAAYVSTS